MSSGLRPRITYANVMATVAVFVALGGGAYASLKKNSVTAKQIATNAVGEKEVQIDAVGSGELKTGSVTATEAADNSIGSGEITDGSVRGADLTTTRVNGSISDGTSNTFFIGEGTVGSADIADGSVRSADLGGIRAVGSISDGTSNTILIGEGTVGSPDLGDGSVRRIDVDNGLGFNCPVGTAYFQGACIETGERAAATFDAALATCVGLGRWLPGAAQLRGFALRADIVIQAAQPNWEWAEFKYYDSDGGASLFRAPVIGEGTNGGVDTEANAHPYRCVAPATGI